MIDIMARNIKAIGLVLSISLLTLSCNSDESTENKSSDDFDREAMLRNWADNIIIPAYEDYGNKVADMAQAVDTFQNKVTAPHLSELREKWSAAYLAWQSVSMFEIGKAEELTLRNFTNIYPADAQEIDKNIQKGSYNLSLPSKNDEQGFPALDYMINGLGSDDQAILQVYSKETTGKQYLKYLSDLTTRLQDMTKQVVRDWKEDGYRDVFIGNNGTSGTSAVNKLANDFMFYYEKSLRAGKIGIPAGAFSSSPLPEKVEALYKGDASKTLFLASLQATQDFFNGKHFNGKAQGDSFRSYLDYLNTSKDGAKLSDKINAQFDATRSTAEVLNDSFNAQIKENNQAMTRTYDELQKNVVMLKVDMFQSLNIKVDFVDADGD